MGCVSNLRVVFFPRSLSLSLSFSLSLYFEGNEKMGPPGREKAKKKSVLLSFMNSNSTVSAGGY